MTRSATCSRVSVPYFGATIGYAATVRFDNGGADLFVLAAGMYGQRPKETPGDQISKTTGDSSHKFRYPNGCSIYGRRAAVKSNRPRYTGLTTGNSLRRGSTG